MLISIDFRELPSTCPIEAPIFREVYRKRTSFPTNIHKYTVVPVFDVTLYPLCHLALRHVDATNCLHWASPNVAQQIEQAIVGIICQHHPLAQHLSLPATPLP